MVAPESLVEWDSYYHRLEAALVTKSAVKSSSAFCVISGAQQGYRVAPESCIPILILGTQMRRGALAAQLLLFT